MRQNIITNRRHKKLIEQLSNPDNWQPSLTKIARATGISVSTIYENVGRLKKKGMLSFKVKVDVFNEPKVVDEAFSKWKEKTGVSP